MPYAPCELLYSFSESKAAEPLLDKEAIPFLVGCEFPKASAKISG
jgi:hypothetical protein